MTLKPKNRVNIWYNILASIIIMALTVTITAAAETKNADKSKDIQSATQTAAKMVGPQAGIDSVIYDENLKMYRVEIKGQYMHMTPDMKYAFVGDVIDIEKKKSILYTPKKVEFSSMPFQDAIKIGNGRNKIAVFMSMTCPHCHLLLKDLVKKQDLTVYAFVYPMSAEGIWCASNKEKAIREAVEAGKPPKAGSMQCDMLPLQRNMDYAREHGIRSTPTIVYVDGDSTVGRVTMARLNEIMAEKGYK